MVSDILIGKSYTWETTSIGFHENNVLATPWQIGSYNWTDENTVIATWYNLDHILKFSADFTTFISTRVNDNYTLIGNLIPASTRSMIPYVYIDYKDTSTELCFLCRKYNLDKSSQRENPGPNDSNHCHPYSLIYNALFKRNKNDQLNFCEIGIAEGRSLLMWEEYFPNSQIYGFEYFDHLINNWNAAYSHKSRIHVNYTNSCNDAQLVKSFKDVDTMFDCIIDDSTHFFKDMIRIIHRTREFLKPGGMIIIEDIQRIFHELWFYNELKDILHEFESVFFVDLEHDRRNSGTVNNDKILILIKKGPPIFNCFLF